MKTIGSWEWLGACGPLPLRAHSTDPGQAAAPGLSLSSTAQPLTGRGGLPHSGCRKTLTQLLWRYTRPWSMCGIDSSPGPGCSPPPPLVCALSKARARDPQSIRAVHGQGLCATCSHVPQLLMFPSCHGSSHVAMPHCHCPAVVGSGGGLRS